MATAVLHPQDYLAATRRDQSSHFFPLTEYPSPVCEYPPVPGRGRDAALGSKTQNWGGSILSRNNSAVGLLPSPGQAQPSTCSTQGRLVPRNYSACGFPNTPGSRFGKNHAIPSHHSTHGSEVLISRQLSVPTLDHVGCTHRSLSERFPLHGAQLHERRRLQHDVRFPSNSALSVSSRAGGAASSCRKLKLSASSHCHDFLCLKRADSCDPSAHYRKRLHPEVSQVEACLGAKLPLKVLADGPGRSICTNASSIAGNKFSVNKQLNRSTSDKVWGRSETPNLQISGKKMVTSLANGAIEGFAVQVKTDVGKVGKTSTCNESAGSDTSKLETAIELKGRSAGHSSVSDADAIWLAMMKGEKWAGPSFFNSPPPSSLPVPSFTILLSRGAPPSAGSKSSNGAGGFGAPIAPDKSSLPTNSHAWDAAFATKDLRRMLRLDNTVVQA